MRGRTNVSGTGFINGDIVEYEVAENNDIMAGDFVQKLKGYNGDERNVLSVGYFVQGATVYQISEDIILIIHSSEGDLFAHYTTYSFSSNSFISLQVSSYIDRYLICSARVGESNRFVVSASGYVGSNTSSIRTNSYIELIDVDESGQINILDSVDFGSLTTSSYYFYGVKTIFQYSKDANENYLFMGLGTEYFSSTANSMQYNYRLFTFSVSGETITKGAVVKDSLFRSQMSGVYSSLGSSYRARSLYLFDNKSLLLFDLNGGQYYTDNYIKKELKLIETSPSLNTEINETELYSYYPTTGVKGSYYYGYFCMGRISEQYAAIIVTENERDSNGMLEGVFDGSKYYLKIYDIILRQIIFSYRFAKDDFLTGALYLETFFIHALGDGKFIFGCSNADEAGMIKALQFTENKQFKQGKYAMIDKFIPQTINTACSYNGIPYIIGFDMESQYITANSFEIDDDLNINIGNKSVRVMKYYNTIDGVAKQSGQAGDIIEVYVPRT